MPLSGFPNGISVFGVPVLGSGVSIPSTTGTYYFVDSVTGTAGGDGKSPTTALSTIDAAVNLTTASKGDVILVMPGHAETIVAAGGIAADVAGISIVGLGHNENRPVVTFGTDVAASVTVGAANIRIANIVFKNNIDSQTYCVDVNAAGCTVDTCEFLEGSSKQYLTAIDINGGAANACDRATIRNCKFYSIAAGAANAIELGEVATRILIEDNIFDGDFSDAAIHNPTGKILTNLIIRRNIARNRQTGDHAIELVSACTGEATDNRLYGDTIGTILDPGSLFCAGNLESALIDTPAIVTPLDVTPRTAVKAAATMTNGQTLFTVGGGPIRILSLVSLCVTANDGTASTLQYSITPTTGAGAQTISAASASLASAAAGASVTLAGTALSTAALLNANGPNLIANPGTVFCPIGTITAVIGVGSTTGTWSHYIRYEPLTTGVTVV